MVNQWLKYGPFPALLHEHGLRRRAAVQEACGLIDGTGVELEEISQAPRKTPGNVRRGDRMPPVRNPFGDAKAGQLDIGEGEIKQFHPPARRPQAPYEAQIATPGQRG